MTQIEAVYERGVFRPVNPVHLPERTRVTVGVPSPAVEKLADEEILDLANATLPAADQEAMSNLLASNREGTLSSGDKDRLDDLIRDYRRGMVFKAHAATEAVSRGLIPQMNAEKP